MKDNEDVGLTEMLELMLKQAIDKNATTISIKGHKCNNLETYCYELTLRHQDDCEECK
jgi:hypothetical protein